jgi:hypothetical protein
MEENVYTPKTEQRDVSTSPEALSESEPIGRNVRVTDA